MIWLGYYIHFYSTNWNHKMSTPNFSLPFFISAVINFIQTEAGKVFRNSFQPFAALVHERETRKKSPCKIQIISVHSDTFFLPTRFIESPGTFNWQSFCLTQGIIGENKCARKTLWVSLKEKLFKETFLLQAALNEFLCWFNAVSASLNALMRTPASLDSLSSLVDGYCFDLKGCMEFQLFYDEWRF